jgi:hypothetical protein
MLVEKALALGVNRILFQSIEVSITAKSINTLYQHLTPNTLVVGAKMHKEHGVISGIQKLEGWITPWNTLALWNLEKLAITGFLPLSGGNLHSLPGGVEEVSVITLLQKLYPHQMDAKIVEIEELHWEVEWRCENRTLYHAQKMASKNERAAAHIHFLGIDSGEVIVINKEKSNG